MAVPLSARMVQALDVSLDLLQQILPFAGAQRRQQVLDLGPTRSRPSGCISDVDDDPPRPCEGSLRSPFGLRPKGGGIVRFALVAVPPPRFARVLRAALPLTATRSSLRHPGFASSSLVASLPTFASLRESPLVEGLTCSTRSGSGEDRGFPHRGPHRNRQF